MPYATHAFIEKSSDVRRVRTSRGTAFGAGAEPASQCRCKGRRGHGVKTSEGRDPERHPLEAATDSRGDLRDGLA